MAENPSPSLIKQNKLSHLNTKGGTFCPLPQSPLSLQFSELGQAKPRLGLSYVRTRYLSSSIFVALSCLSLVLVCEMCSWWAQRDETGSEIWPHRGQTQTQNLFYPAHLSRPSSSHRDRLSELFLLEQLPCFLPLKSLPPWMQQSQQTFWNHQNCLVQGWSKVCAPQLWAKIASHGYSDCLGWGSRNWRKRKKAFCLPAHERKIW